MQMTIDEIRREAENEIAGLADARDLEQFRIRYLARKGKISRLYEDLRSFPPEQRPALGKAINDLRAHLEGLLQSRLSAVSRPAEETPALDLTLPGRRAYAGRKHPLTQTLEEMKSIFVSMGFGIADGPELEDDYHNFGALNFPPDHPARDTQDTFFVTANALLRTHTSPVQIRVMENCPPPVRVIMPGRVYRNEAISSRSYCLFHQLEGLFVDTGVTFADLKGTLISFIRQFYGSGTRYRFRPTFFPFTEPSADIYISCFICGGKGCRLCKQSGWLEILGCGMVDPNVFRSVGYDAEKYTGYAFGMGIERVALLRNGIDDIRLFFENDVRFLNQF